jgi:predicted nucleotide-binding protein (sugar kinase/HSP70/actin superfamily)
MYKTTKLTSDEAQEIKDLRKNMDEITIEFGSISIMEKELEKRKDTVNSVYKVVSDLQTNLMNKIQEKYGKGQINLTTEEFISYGE